MTLIYIFCSPGRFFAANQLKLLLAQIVTKYDIEHVPTRAVNQWINNTIGPPIWETLRVRRRPEGERSTPDNLVLSHLSNSDGYESKIARSYPRKNSITATCFLDTMSRQNLTGGVHELVVGAV